MPEGGEIIGDMAQGALSARAFEPAHGEAAGTGQAEACLNCGTRLIGSHCHQCGQAGHVHKSIGAFLHDLLHGVFHFEGKIWRTLPLLAFRPGKLTREYIDGRRASYVSPIALFLFCVFLMFAVMKNTSFDLGSNADVDVNGKHIVGLKANEAELARLQQERARLVAAGQSTARIDAEIEGRRSGIESLQKISDPALLGTVAGAETKAGTRAPTFETGNPALKEMFARANENPRLALYKLQSSAYKFAWALIPISVPFVWLLFPFNRRFTSYDHTVFVTYSISFMMLLVSVLTVLRGLGLPLLMLGLNVIPPVHLYNQVRGTYGTSRWGAAWRTALLCLFAIFALLAFGVLILALGLGE